MSYPVPVVLCDAGRWLRILPLDIGAIRVAIAAGERTKPAALGHEGPLAALRAGRSRPVHGLRVIEDKVPLPRVAGSAFGR